MCANVTATVMANQHITVVHQIDPDSRVTVVMAVCLVMVVCLVMIVSEALHMV